MLQISNSLALFRRGCPLDETDSMEGDTPLHLATRHANNEMVAILLRKGANTDLLNKVSNRNHLEPSHIPSSVIHMG